MFGWSFESHKQKQEKSSVPSVNTLSANTGASMALFDPTSGKQGLVGVAGSEFNVTRATRFRAGADGCQELERRDEISTYPPTTSWPFSFRFRVRS